MWINYRFINQIKKQFISTTQNMYGIIFLKCQNSCRIILDYRKTVIAGSCYFINNYKGSTQFSASLLSTEMYHDIWKNKIIAGIHLDALTICKFARKNIYMLKKLLWFTYMVTLKWGELVLITNKHCENVMILRVYVLQ